MQSDYENPIETGVWDREALEYMDEFQCRLREVLDDQNEILLASDSKS